MTTNKKTGYRCKNCSSELIRFDAYAYWDKHNQYFVFDGTSGYEECGECNSENIEEFTYD